ncbi:unnamed protein product [Phaeothamnion confervicola]
MLPSLAGALCPLGSHKEDARQLMETVVSQRIEHSRRGAKAKSHIKPDTKEAEILASAKAVFELEEAWLPQAYKEMEQRALPDAAVTRIGRAPGPERSSAHPAYLTPLGRKQLARGHRRCHPAEAVPLPGDPLERPLHSNEFRWLVPPLVWASRRINAWQERRRVGGPDAWAALEAERRRAMAAVLVEYDKRPPDERPSPALIRARLWETARALGPGPFVAVDLRHLADAGNLLWTVVAVALLPLRFGRWLEGAVLFAWGLWTVCSYAYRNLYL